MKIRTVIVDDEQHCIDTLKWQLESYTENTEIIATFDSSVKALSFLNENNIDLLFLDIEMPELNGFELLRKISDVTFDVIFATAYDEFAMKAFKASAIDYLLKPIDKSDLISAVEKVSKKRGVSLLPAQMEILYEALNQQNIKKERIAVPTQTGLHFVKTAEIIYCISESNYTHIHLIDGSIVLVSRTLKEIESVLPQNDFLRIHHSHLINLHRIKKYMRGDGGYVVMDDDNTLNVSRSRKEALLTHFGY